MLSDRQWSPGMPIHALRDMWTMDVLVFPTYCELLMFPKMRRTSITGFVSIVHPVKFDNPWTFFRKNFIMWYNVTKFFTGFACHWRLNSWPKRFIFHDAHWQYYPCPVQIIRYLLNEERWEIRCPLPTTLSSLFTLPTFASNYLVNNCYSVWQEFWGE